jgi:hypothetical protein
MLWQRNFEVIQLRLECIERTQKLILEKIMAVNQGVIDLTAAVAALNTVTTAVATAIAALQAAAGDPDATVEGLAQQVNTSIAALQASVNSIPATASTDVVSSAKKQA